MIISNGKTLRDKMNPTHKPVKTHDSNNGLVVESNQQDRYVLEKEEYNIQDRSTSKTIGSYKVNNGNIGIRHNNFKNK